VAKAITGVKEKGPPAEWKTMAKVENFVKDEIKKFPQAELLAKRPCQLYSFIWINSILLSFFFLSQSSIPSFLPFCKICQSAAMVPSTRLDFVGVPLIIYDSNSVISQLAVENGGVRQFLERSFIIPVITQKYTFVVSPISCVTPKGQHSGSVAAICFGHFWPFGRRLFGCLVPGLLSFPGKI